MSQTNITTLPIGGDWRKSLEAAYLEDFFNKIHSLLPHRFTDFHFHILHHNLAAAPLDLPNFGKNHILIWLSDESSQLPPDIFRKFQFILKSYHLPSDTPPNVHPFPLCGSNSVIRTPPTQFSSRKTTVFFSGNLNKNRAELFYRLKFPSLQSFSFPNSSFLLGALSALTKKLTWNTNLSSSIPGSYLAFTKSFRSGLSETEYASKLSDTQICLCPKGFHTTETIRHFEAMRLGCVILSSPLPPSPFYNGSPILEIPNWRNLRTSIIDLLANPASLEAISRSTLSWWETKVSAHAMAIQTAEYLKIVLK